MSLPPVLFSASPCETLHWQFGRLGELLGPRWTSAALLPGSRHLSAITTEQEYASARWLLFDGLHNDDVHFSDRNVAIANTLDYSAFGLAIEK